MDKETRKIVIAELDTLLHTADSTKQELWQLVERYHLYEKHEENTGVQAAYKAASEYTYALRSASDTLKQDAAGIADIKDTVTGWYRFHVELDVEEPTDPEFESVLYKGNNEWEVIIETPTDGREKVIVQSDTATWSQVYSVDPA